MSENKIQNKENLASFEISSSNFRNMVSWTWGPLNGDRHNQLYFNIQEDKIVGIGNAGKAVMSYCDYEEEFFDSSEVNDALAGGAEAIFRVDELYDFLNFVGGDSIIVSLFGNLEEDDDGNTIGRADVAKIHGDLTATLTLPCSVSNYSSMQLRVVEVYDDDNNLIKLSNGEPLETSFTTDCSEIQKIIDVKDYDNLAMSSYPIVVQDGNFMLSATDKNERREIHGTLYAENVDGPDIDNRYTRGFNELFNVINGEIFVQTEQDKAVSIVKEMQNATLRYNIQPA